MPISQMRRLRLRYMKPSVNQIVWGVVRTIFVPVLQIHGKLNLREVKGITQDPHLRSGRAAI